MKAHNVICIMMIMLISLALISSCSNRSPRWSHGTWDLVTDQLEVTNTRPNSSTYFTGDGGNDIALMIGRPEARRLSEEDMWMTDYVQTSLARHIRDFSNITINENDGPYFLTGYVSKTATTYSLEITITSGGRNCSNSKKVKFFLKQAKNSII